MSNSIDINRDIIINAYYMISLFEKTKHDIDTKSSSSDKNLLNQTIITNLKLQKLMYFVELYYMIKYDQNSMFDQNWSAWNYGPVCKELYDRFKDFGSDELFLNEDEKCQADALSEENKNAIFFIYNCFGFLSAFDLVSLTHMKKSPWYNVVYNSSNNNNIDFNQLNNSFIDKIESKVWFDTTFMTTIREVLKNDA